MIYRFRMTHFLSSVASSFCWLGEFSAKRMLFNVFRCKRWVSSIFSSLWAWSGALNHLCFAVASAINSFISYIIFHFVQQVILRLQAQFSLKWQRWIGQICAISGTSATPPFCLHPGLKRAPAARFINRNAPKKSSVPSFD